MAIRLAMKGKTNNFISDANHIIQPPAPKNKLTIPHNEDGHCPPKWILLIYGTLIAGLQMDKNHQWFLFIAMRFTE